MNVMFTQTFGFVEFYNYSSCVVHMLIVNQMTGHDCLWSDKLWQWGIVKLYLFIQWCCWQCDCDKSCVLLHVKKVCCTKNSSNSGALWPLCVVRDN